MFTSISIYNQTDVLDKDAEVTVDSHSKQKKNGHLRWYTRITYLNLSTLNKLFSQYLRLNKYHVNLIMRYLSFILSFGSVETRSEIKQFDT